MSNFGTLVAEVRSDLRRSGIDNDIKVGIAAALQWYRAKRFSFNEKSFTFSTVAGTDTYTSSTNEAIARIARFDGLYVTVGTTQLPLTGPVDNDLIDQDRMGSTSSSIPSRYAFVTQSIRLDPIPSAVYTITFKGIVELNDPAQASSPTDLRRITRATVLSIPENYTNAFFDEGYEILKAWTKGYVYTNTLRNVMEGRAMFAIADEYAGQKSSEFMEQSSSGGVVPTQF